MKLSLIADTHLFAPNEMKVDFNGENQNEYLLGDIVDLANCKKKEVDKAYLEYKKLKDIYGRRFLCGNHERISVTNDLISPKDGVILAHGDFESWGHEKAFEYRSKPHGAGAFKRKFVVGMVEAFEKSVGRDLDQKFIEAAVKLAKDYGCHTYIAGHLHPKEMIDIIADGIRIIIVPRGKTEVEI